MATEIEDLQPVVVQDRLTGEIRMLAYATGTARARTAESGLATFHSRSRGALWVKGETSGNTIAVDRILVDCDGDAFVYQGDPRGPSCHTGEPSCFFRDAGTGDAATLAAQTGIGRLEQVIARRKAATAEVSYTRSLLDRPGAIGSKIREEADELARAVDGESDGRVVSEAADLVFHALVGLASRGISWRSVLVELDRRAGTSGHDEIRARRKQ